LKRHLVLALVALALSCKDSTKPLDPWVGIWHLVTVDSLTVPVDFTVAGLPNRVVQRTLDVNSGGRGFWTDSSFSRNVACDLGYTATPDRMCNTSGMAAFTWTAVADTLTVVRLFASTVGYVVPVKTFVKQQDGSLLKTDDLVPEVYRR
jgi:hypothetical protein